MIAAVYLRVSTDDQRDRETIKTQREAAERHCIQQNISVYKYYEDDGVSGTVPFDQRPGGKRLLSDARQKHFDVVLIYRLDRLGRDPRLTLITLNDLEALGVRVLSITEAFDATTAAGRFMMTMLSGAAGFERDSILERSRAGTDRLAREGAWLGGICPYGYRVEGKGRAARLVPSEEELPGLDLSEAGAVRKMYGWLADEGRSCIWVADRLNALGVPPAYTRDARDMLRNKRKQATAGVWRASRVRNLIVNTTYMGTHQYGKRAKKAREVISRDVPPLVDTRTWERAQETLRKNQLFSPRNAKRKYLLRGLLKCGMCGLNYIGTSYPRKRRIDGVDVPTGETNAYYACSGKHGAGRGEYGRRGERCPSKSVDDCIEDDVWGDITGFLQNPGAVLADLARQQASHAVNAEQLREEVAQLRKAFANKRGEQDKVVTLFRQGHIDDAMLQKQLDAVRAEEAALQAQIDEAAQRLQGVAATEGQLRSAEALLQELQGRLQQPITWELKRQIVETLVESVVVETQDAEMQKDKSAIITVRYRFAESTRETKNTQSVNCTDTGSLRPPE